MEYVADNKITAENVNKYCKKEDDIIDAYEFLLNQGVEIIEEEPEKTEASEIPITNGVQLYFHQIKGIAPLGPGEEEGSRNDPGKPGDLRGPYGYFTIPADEDE